MMKYYKFILPSSYFEWAVVDKGSWGEQMGFRLKTATPIEEFAYHTHACIEMPKMTGSTFGIEFNRDSGSHLYLVFKNSDVAARFRLTYNFKLDEQETRMCDGVFWFKRIRPDKTNITCKWIDEYI